MARLRPANTPKNVILRPNPNLTQRKFAHRAIYKFLTNVGHPADTSEMGSA
jgi:hypothetical protein